MAVAAPTVAPLRIKLEARRLHIVPIDCPEAARARARAYASISSIMVTGRVSFLVLWGHWNRLKTAPEPGTAAISTRLVLDVCYAGSFVLWRPEDCPPQTPHWPTNPQLMLMMLARPAPKSTPEAITNSVLSDKDRRNKACWEHANSSIFTAFSPLSKAIKKAQVAEISTRNAVVPALSPEAIPRCTETRWKTQKGLAMKRVGGITATPGKLKL